MDTLKPDRELYMKAKMMKRGKSEARERRNKVPRQIKGGRGWARGAHA